nr:fad-dependent monooxygenase mdpd [Quercus suber]
MPSQYQFLADGDENEFDPKRWRHSPSGLPERHPKVPIDVLIVGGGTSGLMTALECWRRGQNVVGILERTKAPVYAGSLNHDIEPAPSTDDSL